VYRFLAGGQYEDRAYYGNSVDGVKIPGATPISITICVSQALDLSDLALFAGHRVVEIRCEDCTLAAGRLHPLSCLPHLRELRFRSTRLVDADFDVIHSLQCLEALDLSGSGVSDCCLELLPPDRSLRWIDVGSNFELITDRTVWTLTRFPALEELYLYDAHVTDASADSFQAFTWMRVLDLTETQVGDGTVRALMQCRRLTELRLEYTRITDSAIACIATFPRLESLWLGSTRITDKSVLHLAKMRRLRELHLEATFMSPVGLAEVRRRLPDCEIHTERKYLGGP
jgi:hypothetical protein